jgi:hypothetical protein
VAYDGGAAPAGVGDAPVGGRGEAAGCDEVGCDARDVATALLVVSSRRHLTDSISYVHHLVYIKCCTDDAGERGWISGWPARRPW